MATEKSVKIESLCHGTYNTIKNGYPIIFRFCQGVLHHETKPSVDRGYIKEWFIHGKRHRLPIGNNILPAVEYTELCQLSSGYSEYFIYGQLYCRRWKDGSNEIYYNKSTDVIDELTTEFMLGQYVYFRHLYDEIIQEIKYILLRNQLIFR